MGQIHGLSEKVLRPLTKNPERTGASSGCDRKGDAVARPGQVRVTAGKRRQRTGEGDALPAAPRRQTRSAESWEILRVRRG